MSAIAKLINTIIERGFEFFGRYYSSYRAFVVDNEDPEGYGRLKLKVPNIYGTHNYDYWAWPKGIYSGKNYGIQCVPSKGDLVYVEFEYGDPKKPIWSYGHFGRDTDNNKEKPTEFDSVKKYGFKTPEGSIVLFNDDDKVITIKTIDGYTLELSQLDKFVKLENSKRFQIIANDTGISLKADKVSLIKLDGADEPGVLGDKNEAVLKDLQSSLRTVIQTLVQIGAADATLATSTYGLSYASSLSSLSSTLATVINIQTKIPQTKSNKVTLS